MLFMTIKMSAEKEIHYGVYGRVVQTGKCYKGKNVYAARRLSKL